MKVNSTSLITIAIAAEVIIGASAAVPSSNVPVHRRGLGRKLRRAVELSNDDHHSVTLKKRDFHGTGTFYGAGVTMGACGHWSDPSENVVALNIGLYGNQNAQSKWCGQQVRITSGGITAVATIVDCCPTCPGNGDLDMSKALFQQFGDLNQGVLDISWHFGGGGGGGGSGKGSSSGNNSNKNKDSNNNDNQQKQHSTTTDKPKSATEMVTQTLFSTLTSTSATATATATADTATVATPTSTDAPASDAQNLAGLGQLMQGMFNMANAVQS